MAREGEQEHGTSRVPPIFAFDDYPTHEPILDKRVHTTRPVHLTCLTFPISRIPNCDPAWRLFNLYSHGEENLVMQVYSIIWSGPFSSKRDIATFHKKTRTSHKFCIRRTKATNNIINRVHPILHQEWIAGKPAHLSSWNTSEPTVVAVEVRSQGAAIGTGMRHYPRPLEHSTHSPRLWRASWPLKVLSEI